MTADGDVLEDVSTVVWCTGSGPDHSWIDLPVCSDDGRPRHERGVSPDEPGLLFLGLDFQFAVASSTIQGVDRDARYLVRTDPQSHSAERRPARCRGQAVASRAEMGEWTGAGVSPAPSEARVWVNQ